MERTSVFYILRRKLQILASYIINDKVLSKFYFKVVMHKKLDLTNPKSFNEKLQWLKLYSYPNEKKVIQCADKYAVREYINEKGYGNKLVPLLGVWDSAKEIDFSKLPKQFVLKCNHGCAYNIVCSDISNLNKKSTIKQLNKWIKEDFGCFNIERHYSKNKSHKIICEEYLGEKLSDFKFFCFNGKPKYMYVSKDLLDDRHAEIGFYYLDGKKMDIVRDDYKDLENIVIPSFYNDMLEMAKSLCKEFIFVRVDFFVTDSAFYFAELTFTPSACMMPFNPVEYDMIWGNELDISGVKSV